MARPLKKGLDYFPMDTSLDFKYQLLKAKYKLEGIGFIDMLYRIIYNEGYYLQLTEDKELILAEQFGMPVDKFNEMVEFCIDKEFFDKKFWNSDRVLTSNGIQKRYFHKTTRRQEQKYMFLLAETDNIDDNNDDMTDNKYTKESKVKENKIKKNKHGENVFLFDDEYKKLSEQFGKEFTDKCIEKLDNYKSANGKKYKSDYRAILNWVIDAVKEKIKPKPMLNAKQEKYYDRNKRAKNDKLDKIYDPKTDNELQEIIGKTKKIADNNNHSNEEQRKKNEDFIKKVESGLLK